MNIINKHFSLKRSLIVIFFCGILCSISIQWFIASAATVPTEVMGVVMGITSTIFRFQSTNYWVLFWTLYFLALIPFIIFGFFKVGRMFTYLTLYFTLISTLFGLFLTYFDDMAGIAKGSQYSITNLRMFGLITNHGIWLRIIYSTLGSLTYATGLGFSLRMGASSGGTDFLAKWFANEKNIHISFMLGIFAIVTLIFATLLFNIIGYQHNFIGTPFSKINYIDLLITFALSVWQCIAGPILIFFIYNKNKDPYHKLED